MTARRDAFVLAVLLLGVATAAGAQGREGGYGWPAAGLAVAGDLSAVIGPVDNDAFFNYTDYEQNALRLARLRFVAEWRPATRLSFVTEIRAESGDALDAAAWYVRWEPFGDALRIQAGRVPPVIGAYARRAYGRDQFGFAPPVPYQYLTSLRPDALPLTIDDVLDMRGRVVTPEDYGVEGAHPVLQIRKLWAAANLWKANEKSASSIPTKGICRVVTHEKASEADLEKARAYRIWMRKLPGCKASYYVTDPATGKGMTISIWETRDQMNAFKEAKPPEGTAALKSLSVEVFPMVEEP